ncbi:hypothetical protein KW795_01580 [Candidatus Microgenomates bacterium]|nr:hypothetical protein [Candidatus Microgenomates bacterium]
MSKNSARQIFLTKIEAFQGRDLNSICAELKISPATLYSYVNQFGTESISINEGILDIDIELFNEINSKPVGNKVNIHTSNSPSALSKKQKKDYPETDQFKIENRYNFGYYFGHENAIDILNSIDKWREKEMEEEKHEIRKRIAEGYILHGERLS